MIAIDDQPFSTVGNAFFISLMKELKLKYNFPSKKYSAEHIIPYIYSKMRIQIKKAVVNTVAISVSTDLWINTNNLQRFLILNG